MLIESASSNCVCREAFPATVRILDNIVKNLREDGRAAEWDINNILMRYAMDMTSIVVSDLLKIARHAC